MGSSHGLPRESKDSDGRGTAGSIWVEKNVEKGECVEEWEAIEEEEAKKEWKMGRFGGVETEEVWVDFSGGKRNGRMIQSAFARL